MHLTKMNLKSIICHIRIDLLITIFPIKQVQYQWLYFKYLCFFLGTVFQGTKIYIVPAGIGKSRCDIFHRQVIQNGGEVVSTFSPSCTHVIVDDSVDCKRALRLLKVERLPSAVHLVKCTWLSACISEKSLLAPLDYSLLPPER